MVPNTVCLADNIWFPWSQINSFSSALIVYAQNLTGLQVRKVHIPVLLNILFKSRSRLVPAGKSRFIETQQSRGARVEFRGRNAICGFTPILDGTDAGGAACESGSCAGAGRVISRLKSIHFGFAGRQIGVCHCGRKTTVCPHRGAGCSSSPGCGCLGSADLAFGRWPPERDRALWEGPCRRGLEPCFNVTVRKGEHEGERTKERDQAAEFPRKRGQRPLEPSDAQQISLGSLLHGNLCSRLDLLFE